MTASCLMTALLAGCIDEDPGPELAAKVDASGLDQLDGVSEMTVDAGSAGPFLGHVEVDLVLEDDLPVEDVARVMDEAGSYLADLDDAYGEIVADGVVVEITGDAESADLAVRLLDAFRQETVFSAVRVRVTEEGQVATIGVEPAPGTEPIGAFDAADAVCGRVPGCEDVPVSAWRYPARGGDEVAAMEISQIDEPDLDVVWMNAGSTDGNILRDRPAKGEAGPAIEAYRDVAGAVPVRQAVLSPTGAGVWVDGRHLGQALQVASAAGESHRVPVGVTGGNVGMGRVCDHSAVHAVIEAYRSAPGVEEVWSACDDSLPAQLDVDVVTFTVESLPVARGVVDGLGDVPEAARLGGLTLDGPDFRLDGSVAALPDLIAAAEAAEPHGGVYLVRDFPNGNRSELSPRTLSDVEGIVAAARPVLRTGDRVGAGLAGKWSTQVSFDVAPTIEVSEDSGSSSAELAQALEAAWNE